MNHKDFESRYPTLAGTLAGEFHDSPTVDDAKNARNLRMDLSVYERIGLLRELLADAHALGNNINRDWEVMAAEANRSIHDVSSARAWLLRVTDVWQEELARLENKS